MLCSRCNKRPAVVFIATNADASSTQGLCLVCAKELGIKPVTDIIDKMGISEEQLEAMQDQFSGLMSLDPEDGDLDLDELGDDFMAGGAPTFPFLQNIFSDSFSAGGKETKEEEKNTHRADNSNKRKKSKG